MDPNPAARQQRDRGLRKVKSGTRWLVAGAVAGVAACTGALALPQLVQKAEGQVDTTSGTTGDPVGPSAPSGPPTTSSSSGGVPSTSRSTPPTTSFSPPVQAPSSPRRRSHSVTGAS